MRKLLVAGTTFAIVLLGCTGGASTPAPTVTATPTPAGTTAPTPAPTPTPTLEPADVVVAWVPLLNFAPLYLAVEKGYLTEQAITVDLNVSQGGAEITALLGNGTVDASFSGISAGTFAAIDRGIDIKLVLPITQHPPAGEGVASAFMVRQALWDSGEVKTAKDLQGRKVALNAPGGIAEYLVEKILAKHGLTLDDIDRTYLSFGDMPAALTNGAVDAAFMGDPAATLVSKQGVAKLLEADSAPTPGLQSSLLFFGPRFINERNDVAKRFSLAIEKAIRDLAGDGLYKAENRDIITKYVKIPADVYETTLTTTLFATDPTLDPSALLDQQEFFIRAGKLDVTTPIDPSIIIDDQFSKYVLAELGPYVPGQ